MSQVMNNTHSVHNEAIANSAHELQKSPRISGDGFVAEIEWPLPAEITHQLPPIAIARKKSPQLLLRAHGNYRIDSSLNYCIEVRRFRYSHMKERIN
jgi:hypothetical protein